MKLIFLFIKKINYIPVIMILLLSSAYVAAEGVRPIIKDNVCNPKTDTDCFPGQKIQVKPFAGVRKAKIGDLVTRDTVVELNADVQCTSGGKKVKCPDVILVKTSKD